MVQGYTKRVKTILLSHGWTMIRRGKGDHEVWAHPNAPKPVVVDGKIMSRHTANAVLKRARIKEKL